jgi:hypothetical protein
MMDVKGDYLEGLGLARRSLEQSRGMNPHQLMHGTCPVIAALYELGRWEEIAPVLEEHLQAFLLDPAVECLFVRDGPVLGALLAAKSGQPARARELAALIPTQATEPEEASAWQSMLATALGHPDLAREMSRSKVIASYASAPNHARSMLEALIALEAWDELEQFLPVARRFVAGLAILGPCCDRAEALVRRHRGDKSAVELLERAEKSFEELHAGAELAATHALLSRWATRTG